MIYVTHDQIEAMTLADRIVLMRDGVIEQQGAPLDLFERPASTFVAGFLGSPRMSFLPGTLALERRRPTPSASATRRVPLAPSRRLDGAVDGQPVLLGLRPEHLTRAHGAGARGRDRSATTRRSSSIQPTGSRSYATFRLAGAPVMAELQAHDVSRPGEQIADRHQHDARLDLRRRAPSARCDGRRAMVSRAVRLCGTELVDPPMRTLTRGPAVGRVRQRRAALHPLRRRRGAARHRLPRARRELGHLHAHASRTCGSTSPPTASASAYRAHLRRRGARARLRRDDHRRQRRLAVASRSSPSRGPTC